MRRSLHSSVRKPNCSWQSLWKTRRDDASGVARAVFKGGMRIALLLLAACIPLSACGSVAGGAQQFRAGFGAAATAPLDDFNLRRELIPTVLLQAEANPYDLRNLTQCTPIGAEIRRLDTALGPDTGEPAPPDGSLMSERAADAASAAALLSGESAPVAVRNSKCPDVSASNLPVP